MLSPQETGTIPGGFPGARERPGNRYLPRVLGTGGRRVAPGWTGNRTAPVGVAGKPAELETAGLGSWLGRRGETGKRPGRNGEAGQPAERNCLAGNRPSRAA